MPAAGRTGRVVGGADEAGEFIRGFLVFFFFPEVVPHRDDLDAHLEQFFVNFLCDAVAVGGIFPVGNDDIRLILGNIFRNKLAASIPPQFSDNIPDKKYLHYYFAVSEARVSRITVTRTSPGYSSSDSIFFAISCASFTAALSSILSGWTMTRTSLPAWMA